MHTHGPSCLEGPISRHRKEWRHWPEEALLALLPLPTNGESSIMNPTENSHRPEDNPIRWELVERVREEIEAGVYDTPEKWEIALDRLLNQLEP